MKNRVINTVMAGILVLAMTGCTGGAAATGEAPAPAPAADDSAAAETTAEAPAAEAPAAEEAGGGEVGAVGFSISTMNNPFFVSMAEGAEAKAKELGVDLTIVDAANDTAKQTTDIEDLISKNVKVLIVNPADSASIAPTIKDAQAAGIKVVAVDRYVEGDLQDTFIGTDNVAAGEEAGKAFLEAVGEGAKVAILEGVPGASSAIERQQGFMNAIDGHVDIVASQTANFDRAEGLTVTEDILQAHPEIVGILSANDEMALGALEACDAAGKKPGQDILVTGFDAGDDARAAVKDGRMLFTVEQQTVLMGETAVETALKYMNGESVDARIPIDVIMVNE